MKTKQRPVVHSWVRQQDWSCRESLHNRSMNMQAHDRIAVEAEELLLKRDGSVRGRSQADNRAVHRNCSVLKQTSAKFCLRGGKAKHGVNNAMGK